MSNLLEINNVVKRYGDFTALNNVSIHIPKGSVFGLLGPNGAGKTSLIRIINQITMPDSGEVILDGEKLAPNHVEHIGYLPEERGLYKSMKVGEQALYLAQLKGLSKTEAKKRLKYWFDKFDISTWWDKKIEELSKGMAQKVQFIVTVLHEPKLLIFDEPFSGFDPINAQLIAQEILQLRDKGATIIFSTHRMESVEEMCDEIALIDKSNKILDGKLADIKRQFRTNTFQVGLNTDNPAEVQQKLKESFEVFPADFKLLNDGLTMNVKLTEGNSANDLLSFLTSKGQVQHFVELIPSANDIFIQAVNKNS
ncbi:MULTISPECIES: ABC transporter ATP-binding protein [Tenacibaculum]|uniref:ABC transporter ATP-binding protein n=1 Tax=Tenacibaculum TaxID=104267 RepID=UPI001F0A7ED3|nr:MULTISPECIES: ABC transporter ATP-binding protein [Tenacibaculum]MCH3882409.1 ABC transporter ATP-binding protein [Tenacibaculum aquimarinum]MCH3885804.1 ABC transporter ATP-binding protein [Tenacibaculum aquimarinum]MDO6600108.1 ABC transporter ATP-binding protein [Tenacibaculum sp. 1_MG-2023]